MLIMLFLNLKSASARFAISTFSDQHVQHAFKFKSSMFSMLAICTQSLQQLQAFTSLGWLAYSFFQKEHVEVKITKTTTTTSIRREHIVHSKL
jgi:hypothetical protein